MAEHVRTALVYCGGLAFLSIALIMGEYIKDALSLAVPVPVLAVLMLLAGFFSLGYVPVAVRRVSAVLLPHMALFFIPVLVGLLAISDMLAAIFIPLLLIIIVSTIIPLWATAWLFERLAPPLENEKNHADE